MLILDQSLREKPIISEDDEILQIAKSIDLTYMVAYTDGGAKPNPGFGGYGMHAYIFDNQQPKQGSGAKSTPTVGGYVDGKESSVNVIAYVDAWGALGDSITNNVGELEGVVCAFKTALSLEVKGLVIHTDSTYAKDCITKWVHNWKKNNWVTKDGVPVKNKEKLMELVELENALKSNGVKIEFKWVKGHNGNLGNTIADNLATKGVIASSKGVEHSLVCSKAKGYWNDKNDYNYLFSKTYWYFNTNTTTHENKSFDNRFIYYTGRHNDDDVFLGKKTPDASYCVVLVTKPEPVLELVRDKLNTISKENGNTSNEVVIGELNTITRAKVYNDILFNDCRFTYLHKDGLRLLNYDESVLAKIKRPARMAFFAVDYLQALEATLESFYKKDKLISSVDITDDIYDPPTGKSKKSTLKKCFGVGAKTFKATAKLSNGLEVSVKLLFDMDLPSRNALAKLADTSPRIHLVTWFESDVAFRYACVVESGEDASIWSSVHSNLILL